MRDWMYAFSMCVIISITYRERNEEKKKKKGGGIFARHSTKAMATKERYLFFQITRLHRCLFLFASFFRVCVLTLYSTTIITLIMIIHLTSKRCFLRSMYKSILQRYVRKCRSLQKKRERERKKEEEEGWRYDKYKIEGERESPRKKEGISNRCFCVHMQVTFFFLFVLWLFSIMHCLLQCFPHGNKDKYTQSWMKATKARGIEKSICYLFFLCLSSTMSCINYTTSFSLSLRLPLFLFTINLSILNID